ncbi:MAG: flippase [Chloroflexi bacterium]|nr:flippase [Chloroflexota bacterium]
MTALPPHSAPLLQTNVPSAPIRGSTLETVARNTAAMLAGQILIKILAFVFSVFVVRRLGAAHFGRYAAALAYVGMFAMFTDLGMSSLSVREMAREEANIAWMVPNITMLRALLSLGAIVVITLSAWVTGKAPDMVLGIFIASCGLLLYAFQGPLDSVMIARERLDFSSAFALLNQMTFMILGTILLIAGLGYVGLLVSSLGGVLVMGLGAGYVVRRVLSLRLERPNPRVWWSLLRASLPFGVEGTVREFAGRFDTVYMSFVLTDAAVGWYNVPYNLISMMLLLAQSVALSIYPTLIKEYDSGRGSIDDTVQRALRYLLLLSIPIAVGGMLLADRIIPLLYGQEFAAAVPAMQVLVWALPPMFLAEIVGRTSTTMHLEKKAARVSVINALLGIVLNVLLVPRFGVVGAAIAMVVSRLTRVILLAVIIGPAMLFGINAKPLLRVVGAGMLMGCVVWLLGSTPLLVVADDMLALLILVGVGTVVYSAASLILGAITPGELRHIYGMVARRMPRLVKRE